MRLCSCHHVALSTVDPDGKLVAGSSSASPHTGGCFFISAFSLFMFLANQEPKSKSPIGSHFGHQLMWRQDAELRQSRSLTHLARCKRQEVIHYLSFFTPQTQPGLKSIEMSFLPTPSVGS